jgi:hypothetical protein
MLWLLERQQILVASLPFQAMLPLTSLHVLRQGTIRTDLAVTARLHKETAQPVHALHTQFLPLNMLSSCRDC